MKSQPRLVDYLRYIQEAAEQTLAYIAGMDLAAFQVDRRTQQAVLFNFVILAEASAKVMDAYPTLWRGTLRCRGARFATCATGWPTATSRSMTRFCGKP